MRQKELYTTLRRDLLAARERIAAAVRPLDAARLNEHPEPKGWSIADVLEHLCITDGFYDEPIAALLKTARPDAGAPNREWKPTFIGNMIARSLERPRPVSAPRLFRPGQSPRNAVAETLLARELAMVKNLDHAESLDWRTLRIATPVLPAWMPRLNLGDAFRIHVVHLGRHAGQIERVAGKL
ncbi:MAG: hypothetical protein JWM95_481 [Gemmatimonadetes bacterium]|nr:hypothetical protein [Gemmatimonadota bacterium]